MRPIACTTALLLAGALAAHLAAPLAMRAVSPRSPAGVTVVHTAITPSTDDSAAIDLARAVRPILSENCFKCHGPDPSSREAGLRLDTAEGLRALLDDGLRVVNPGDRETSALWQRIVHDNPDDRMPPAESGKSLSPEQIETLGRWIDAGARAWRGHWSFEPLTRPVPPEVSNPDWVIREIDAFVLARLDSEGLAPSPEADRAALIRRVSLDLTGLPPTPEETRAFLEDDAPDAYERVVDRLLASPRFGERWARIWLDLARYADTKGYEKDAGRTVWPYRDWLIRALNDDMPFDEFTIAQIAGDMLPGATDDDILATTFHRNTMTNDEGGTDDEEFRVAAVKDRVNTTMSVWMGLTAACAECHTHKYDPITQTEYYRLYDFFNQTADADRNDEAPTHPTGEGADRARLEEINAALAETRSTIDAIAAAELAELADLADLAEFADAAEAPAPQAAPQPLDEPQPFYWINDDSPAGAPRFGQGGPSAWTWVPAAEHPSASGARSLLREANGFSQIYIQGAPIPLPLHEGDRLITHVWLDADRPPREIMLQIHTVRAGWKHRAYWGENLIEFGADDSPERLHQGELPDPGRWVRLEIEPGAIGLEPGDEINGWAFTQHDGLVRWDGAGLLTRHPPDHRWTTDSEAWARLMREREGAELPQPVREALLAGEQSPDRRAVWLAHYARHFHAPTRAAIRPLEERAAQLASEQADITARMPRVPVMAELPPDQRRTTHRLEAGSFLAPAEAVTAGVPAVLHPMPEDAPPNRLGLARWLVDDRNPLTARVTVNRFWERFFGRGLVTTLEDFGVQGSPPSHPDLLDHLAAEFIRNDWSIKALCRNIVTSATYRQSSRITPERRERDPYNVLLARAPSFRLEAETLRDQALSVSGLLSPKMFGPPVYPPQPDGIWQVVYSGEQWMTSTGEDRYRRALYTYWRRTSPYPSMVTFDAPSREVCTPRRLRTNTPLQAFITLNDPVYVEAAQALARRMIEEGGPLAADRVARGFLLCLARPPTLEETDAILDLVADAYPQFQSSDADALALATDPLGPLPEGLDPAEAAAWTVAANVLLNLDEFLTRP